MDFLVPLDVWRGTISFDADKRVGLGSGPFGIAVYSGAESSPGGRGADCRMLAFADEDVVFHMLHLYGVLTLAIRRSRVACCERSAIGSLRLHTFEIALAWYRLARTKYRWHD